MDQLHPVTPPPELIRKWNEEAATAPMADQRYIAAQAARWGADAELEACCALIGSAHVRDMVRAARRPNKPPSLAEEALDTLKTKKLLCFDHPEGYNIIHRALKRLQELENNG